jgi:hypothetical protein
MEERCVVPLYQRFKCLLITGQRSLNQHTISYIRKLHVSIFPLLSSCLSA